jgi:3D (Asp-Asp-Asp) domain-containing protein
MSGMRACIGAAAVLLLLILDASLRATQAPAVVGGCPSRPPDTTHRIIRPRWLARAVVTEYYPVREQWFDGKPGRAPGLATRHRLDWLYGPHGVAMNGEGLGRDGRFYHFAGPYDIGWINRAGRLTSGCWNGTWTNGAPAWLDLGWRNANGDVTYPLAAGGWSNGAARRYVPAPTTLRFIAGRSRPLPFWHTVAVDPKVVPLGSRVFIPAYCKTPAHGWFRALDTGGAIIGYHFDVYRAPPGALTLRAFRGQHVYVLPPGFGLPHRAGASCP